MSDRRERLEKLRDDLRAAIDVVDPDKLAPLAKQYRDTLAEIDDLAPEQEGDALDELTSRRAAKAEVPQRAKRRSS